MTKRWAAVLAGTLTVVGAGRSNRGATGDLEFFTGEALFTQCSARPGDADYRPTRPLRRLCARRQRRPAGAAGAGRPGRVCLPAAASPRTRWSRRCRVPRRASREAAAGGAGSGDRGAGGAAIPAGERAERRAPRPERPGPAALFATFFRSPSPASAAPCRSRGARWSSGGLADARRLHRDPVALPEPAGTQHRQHVDRGRGARLRLARLGRGVRSAWSARR